MSSAGPTLALAELDALVEGAHRDPHHALGVHRLAPNRWVLRVFNPTVGAVAVPASGADTDNPGRLDAATAMDLVDARGLYELVSEVEPQPGDPVELIHRDGAHQLVGDPYRFAPTLGPLDLHLIGEGRHRRLWEVLGARPLTHQGTNGVAFAVWAPNAMAVRVVGDFNGWDGRVHPMRNLGSSGVWELFIPLVEAGARYKFEVVGADGHLTLRADPLAQAAEVPPATASLVAPPGGGYAWGDEEWMAARAGSAFDGRLSVYEVHLGSWRRNPLEGNRSLTYRELASELADYVAELGFTHVELLPIAEHPFGGSWGYQVTGFYAPTARYGSPDELRALVDTFHQRGIGVIVDWVPAHFPRDAFALARFDGTALYEHDDPRQGSHPDWGTLVFNYGRNEVRNFLIANALYWLEMFHIDGLRVDAVASMLYLDYSRGPGQWVPNIRGGRENLDAISFLQELNAAVGEAHPGVLTIAEESTAWEGVTRPTSGGGLGFTHKWNMGWMHDTLEYFSKDPIYRSFEHDKLTFGLVYVWHENFVSPLSHDEVVHGKGSLIAKMPGDDWQRFANLRALYGWMWAHPGKQLLFMGSEFAQWQEWSEARSLDWHLLDYHPHRGVADLVAELNAVQAAHPALYSRDFSAEGFSWLDGSNRAESIYAFARHSEGACVVCIANLTPVPRRAYRVGLPSCEGAAGVAGPWRELLNTDATRFGGSGIVNTTVVAEPSAWQGCGSSAVLDLPPLGVIWLGR